MLTYNTLPPSYLVALKSSISGNVRYYKQELESEHQTDSGAAEARWETLRVKADADEYDRATKVRNTARALVARVCIDSGNGLLCKESRKEELDSAIRSAQAMCRDFNETASVTNISVTVKIGYIAADDVQALKDINQEVRGLIDEMARGVERLDVDAVRKAANRAREVGQALSPAQQERVQDAIDLARATAKQIVKAGENAALEIDQAAIQKLTAARTAFLDLDDSSADVAAPQMDVRGIDLDVSSYVATAMPVDNKAELDI